MKNKFLKAACSFVSHSLMSTFITNVCAAVLVYQAFAVLHGFHRVFSGRLAGHLLTQVPWFPVQIATGLLFGLFMGRFMSCLVLKLLVCVPIILLFLGVVSTHREGLPVASLFSSWQCTVISACANHFLFVLPALSCAAYLCGAALFMLRSTHTKTLQI